MAGPPASADVVIVGGGSAGCALAARLSEDSRRSVLLLEAGSDHATDAAFPPESRLAASLAARAPGHPNNWSLRGTLIGGRQTDVVRGKIVGGSSAINGCYFVRGTRADFDAWAAMGLPSWSYDEVLPFFRGLEDDADYDDELHGRGGPIPVRRQGGALVSPITEAFLEACRDCGFPEEPDKNRPGTPGAGLVPVNIVDGVRVNAAMGYVNPIRRRANLTVRGNTLVARVVVRGRRAVAVEVLTEGRREVIRAGEVVVCCGALKSPQLLLLSGIGPEAELRRHGIDVVQEAPGVGRGFEDHPQVAVSWHPRRTVDAHPGANYFQAALSCGSDGSIGDDVEIIPTIVPVAARDDRPAELQLLCKLTDQESRGDVRLASADPRAAPVIDYRYLSAGDDVQRLAGAARVGVTLLRSSPLSRLAGGRSAPSDDDLASTRAVERWVRHALITSFHTAGTCRMGPASDPAAVVDEACRVRGVEGLRVVDTSVMPRLTRRGPAASAVMIGERVAELMRSAG